jgi:hypothetical protein
MRVCYQRLLLVCQVTHMDVLLVLNSLHHCLACAALLQCYWFYRPREVPEAAWGGVQRKAYSGAQFAFKKGKRLQQEEHCERQVRRHRAAWCW